MLVLRGCFGYQPPLYRGDLRWDEWRPWILKEDLIDLARSPSKTSGDSWLRPLPWGRFKLKRAGLRAVIEVFEAHNIRYFFMPAGMIRKIR